MSSNNKIQKWGNSLAVHIPKQITNKLNLYEGSAVTVVFDNSGIFIKPETPKKNTLEDLVEEITTENLHKRVSWGEVYGKEIW